MPAHAPNPASQAAAAAGPAEPCSTGFGTTLFDALTPAAPALVAASGSVFDVCHIGVLSRALLFVQGLLGIGPVDEWLAASRRQVAAVREALVAAGR
jgi:hypothetical protein